MRSTAYNLTIDKIPFGKLFLKQANNNGAKVLPFGTPDVTWAASLFSLLTRNCCCFPVRKSFNHSSALPWTPYLCYLWCNAIGVIPYRKLKKNLNE